MKASNPLVMVQAYRHLVSQMNVEGMAHPLHLGVTEAGEGEDGRIKSAVGIGALLEDGLGDTVRVSLTEEPEEEIPVARTLVERYNDRSGHQAIPPVDEEKLSELYHPLEHERRKTNKVVNMGDHEVPRIMADLSGAKEIKPTTLFALGYQYSVPLDKWNITDMACDFIYVGGNSIDFQIPGTLGVVQDLETWRHAEKKERHYPILSIEDLKANPKLHDELNFVRCDLNGLVEHGNKIQDEKIVLVLRTQNAHGMAEQRRAFLWLKEKNIDVPVIIERSYNGSGETTQLNSSTDIGGLLLDGFGDGVFLRAEKTPQVELNSTAFGILQATRTRISRTEYISCPSCGRTLFDLQETTAKIRKRTDHLKGLKIGIMGCIVNGPGEMADADYGYVGTGVGKITLYKEKEVVKRNVPTENAVDELIELIKEHGDWVEVVEI
jgi:(E)-4-hydroxy-3-methylbut-2-enyl-diphosphate synthase